MRKRKRKRGIESSEQGRRNRCGMTEREISIERRRFRVVGWEEEKGEGGGCNRA